VTQSPDRGGWIRCPIRRPGDPCFGVADRHPPETYQPSIRLLGRLASPSDLFAVLVRPGEATG